MKAKRRIDIPDLIRRADAVLASDADIDTALEGRPIDHDLLEAAMNGPVTKGKPKRRRERQDCICYDRPRCPRCRGIDIVRVRSIADQGDGSSLSWMVCRGEGCAHRFRMVLE